MRHHSDAACVALSICLSGIAVVLAGGCKPEVDAPAVTARPAVIQPTRGIHLRAAFDDDPTVYVGRFVPDALALQQIDETTAAQTRCSEHFGYKVVNASQEFDEVVYTSGKGAGQSGLKPIAGVGASNERGSTLRVRYSLKKRMQVAVKDSAALARCCAAAPDQCSGKVIGEFLMGTGEVYEVVGAKAEIEVSGAAKLGGEVSYKDDLAWKRVNSFKDMYFAFLTTAGPTALAAPQGDDASCSWCDTIPTSLDGTYFCGISAPAPSESMARDLAMRNAREQVVKFLGEYLTAESATHASLIEGYLNDVQLTTAAASGLASQVKDTKWCKAATTSTPEGPKLTAKVLAFFPNAEKKRAATTTIELMLARPKDPKHKGDDVALRALLKKVK